MSSCGTCSMCCRIPFVKRAEGDPRFSDSTGSGSKPAGEWCKHCKPKSSSGGCGIYEDRGEVCRDYQCYWLQTQEGDAPMPLSLRPDKSKCLIQPARDRRTVQLIVLPEHWDVWEKGVIGSLVRGWDQQGVEVIAVANYEDGRVRRKALTDAAKEKIVRLTMLPLPEANRLWSEQATELRRKREAE